MYHAANTVLQLEDLPTIQPTKEKKVKDYRPLMPVKTLIWLVDDSLKLKDDFLSHQLLPSNLLTFILDDQQWQANSWSEAQATRNQLLQLLDNKAKNLPFLRSNQLIFAFQRNIVKNKKLKPYAKWFEFAQKTRNENNQKEDFDIYTTDDIFSEMIRKLSHKSLDAEDFSFIKYYRLLEGQKDVWEQQYKEEGEQKRTIEMARTMLKDGMTIHLIAKYTGLTEQAIIKLKQ